MPRLDLDNERMHFLLYGWLARMEWNGAANRQRRVSEGKKERVMKRLMESHW